MQYVRHIKTGRIHEIIPKEFWEHNKKEDYVKSTYTEYTTKPARYKKIEE
jgi:hypothetical protein